MVVCSSACRIGGAAIIPARLPTIGLEAWKFTGHRWRMSGTQQACSPEPPCQTVLAGLRSLNS